MAPLNITAFAEAWTALYAHFNAIGYLPSKSVVYPPFSPALPLVHDSIDLHPLILELLPIIPHPVSYEVSCSFEVLPNTQAVPYTEHTSLQLSRDPLKYFLDGIVDEEYVTKELSAEEVLLTTQLPYGRSLILNVGTLREYSTSEYPPVQEDKLVVPEDPYDYRNWPQLPAVETVWSYVRKFEGLEWIAFCGDVEGGIIESFGHESSNESSSTSMAGQTRLGGMIGFEREMVYTIDW
ncbi:hypothetical protein BGW36DRAFT_78478 [Talaromyces proteolyticus]|uniref:Uncharacterized protein n=1 Tax=Talaromyces proteolyticus TaxID=1131652 RepID=A0AAD4KEK4_9EURO|nr:uncharacterized protein BGW36DRAFT_78478 [Talaromyces proteolyticus]KAH8689190.1 hypothetical protein BGW36DRAFT_78478 [Talaromyces proteolyticus]